MTDAPLRWYFIYGIIDNVCAARRGMGERTNLNTTFRYAKPYLRRIIGVLAVKFTGTMMDLVLPWLLAFVIDDAVPTGDRGYIVMLGALMLVCAVIAIIGNITANRMSAAVSRDITIQIRHDVYEHISELSFRDIDDISVPSLLSRLTNDTYNFHNMLDRIQRLGVRAPLLVLGGTALTLILEPTLALVLVGAMPVLGLLVYFVSKKGVKLYARVQRKVEELVRTVRENAMGVRVIKALSKEDSERRRFAHASEDVRQAEGDAGIVMAVTDPAMSFILNTGLAVVLIVGAYRVNAGLMLPGKIIAFLSYFTIILNAMLSVTKLFVILSRGTASADRLGEILARPVDTHDKPRSHVENGAHIEFENVSFSYGGVTNDLEGVSFKLRRGGTLGIIGPTGSGKTTLVSLLMRFYSPSSGTVRINGDDIEGIPAKELRAMFGAVFQNDVLLNDTVSENIKFMRDISDGDMELAARSAQAAQFIEALPLKYAEPLDIRGANLSGGQKQRILISRALAGRPDILVLDDAESALDYATDAALRRAIHESYGDTTTVIISERISSIRNADLILVMEHGKIAASGTHEELMEINRDYREIAEIQLGAS